MSEGQSLSPGANYSGVKQSGQQITVVMREALHDGVCKTASRLFQKALRSLRTQEPTAQGTPSRAREEGHFKLRGNMKKADTNSWCIPETASV